MTGTQGPWMVFAGSLWAALLACSPFMQNAHSDPLQSKPSRMQLAAALPPQQELKEESLPEVPSDPSELIQGPILGSVPDLIPIPPEFQIGPLAEAAGGRQGMPQDAATPRDPWKARTLKNQAVMRRKYGGSPSSEKAVQLALDWLAKQQNPQSGFWRLDGPFRDGLSAHSPNQNAATALALLAFQGNGHTHKSGLYKKVVAKGWGYLLQEQNGDGDFFAGDAPFPPPSVYARGMHQRDLRDLRDDQGSQIQSPRREGRSVRYPEPRSPRWLALYPRPRQRIPL